MDENNNKNEAITFYTNELVEKYTTIYVAIFILTGIPGLFSLAVYFYERSTGTPYEIIPLLGLGFSLFILLDWLVGRISLKYICKNHKLMLLGTIWKFIIFSISLIFMMIFFLLIFKVPLKIHLILFILANIAGIPMYINWLKHPEKFNNYAYSRGAAYYGIFGIMGIICSKVLGYSGTGDLRPIIIFYVGTFVIVLFNIPISLFVYQYINYDKIYTKELLERMYDYDNNVSTKSKKKRLQKKLKKNECRKAFKNK